MKKQRGDKSSKAVIAERQGQVVEKLKEGQSEAQIAEEVGISRMTLYRYLQALDATFVTENQEALKQLKKKVGEALLEKADAVETGRIGTDQANSWRSIMADFSKLMGLNAESRSVVAHLSADSSPLLLKFRKACADLTENQMEAVFKFAASLPRETRTTVKDASWFPPQPRLLEGKSEDDAS